ncbi:MAG: hypothetical protein H6622_01615 [Halobacteriovoraceae bacterium]|nr:hypothetical protein [Halobacteriovoraceae bacterium]
MKLLALIIFFNVINCFAAQDRFSLSFGPVRVGESRIPINIEDFSHIVKSSKYKIQAKFEKNSVQWIRNEHNLLTPRARFSIKIFHPDKKLLIQYLGRTITLQKSEHYLKTDIYVPLFTPSTINIFEQSKNVAQITFHSRPPIDKTETKLIDYSCIRYKLNFEGIENDYVSVGCHMERIGKLGKETPRLEVTWTTTNYKTVDGAEPPYMTVLTSSEPSIIPVIDPHGNKKDITLTANLPKRIHRVNTAWGFGPYLFRSQRLGQTRDYDWAPSAMFYGKFEFDNTTSLRFFDAAVLRDSLFNNFGLYFAYELAEVFDKRISIIPLLGIQGLTFRYGPKGEVKTDLIYPQGFEFSFRHPFGLKNYVLGGGMFLDASSVYDYSNAWIRFGKGIFWELNYISWDDKAGDKTAMYGISVGLPLVSFF